MTKVVKCFAVMAAVSRRVVTAHSETGVASLVSLLSSSDSDLLTSFSVSPNILEQIRNPQRTLFSTEERRAKSSAGSARLSFVECVSD